MLQIPFNEGNTGKPVRNNIPSPRFIKVTDTSFNQSELNLCYPLIVKPTDRSGSRGVEKVDTEGELKAAVERAFSESFKHEAIIEEFIDGTLLL